MSKGGEQSIEEDWVEEGRREEGGKGSDRGGKGRREEVGVEDEGSERRRIGGGEGGRGCAQILRVGAGIGVGGGRGVRREEHTRGRGRRKRREGGIVLGSSGWAWGLPGEVVEVR